MIIKFMSNVKVGLNYRNWKTEMLKIGIEIYLKIKHHVSNVKSKIEM